MKYLLLVMGILYSSLSLAGTPGDFVQQSLFGANVNGSQINSVKIDCSYINLFANNYEASIPVDSVDIFIYFGDTIGFACINGGGCIKSSNQPGQNDLNISKLVADGLKESVSKAFKLHQKSCGGRVKRPY